MTTSERHLYMLALASLVSPLHFAINSVEKRCRVYLLHHCMRGGYSQFDGTSASGTVGGVYYYYLFIQIIIP